MFRDWERRLCGSGAGLLYVRASGSGGDGNLSCSWLLWFDLIDISDISVIHICQFCLQWFLHLMRKKWQSMKKSYHIWTSVSKERYHSEAFFNGKLYRLLLLITKPACTALKHTAVCSIRLSWIKIFDLTKDFGSHLHASAQAAERAVMLSHGNWFCFT